MASQRSRQPEHSRGNAEFPEAARRGAASGERRAAVVCRRLVTSATTIYSFHRKPFFLLEHESDRRHKSKRALRCYTTLRNFTAPNDVPARLFSPHSNVCSLASATIHAAFEPPRPPRPSPNLTLSSPRHCNNTAIVD